MELGVLAPNSFILEKEEEEHVKENDNVPINVFSYFWRKSIS